MQNQINSERASSYSFSDAMRQEEVDICLQALAILKRRFERSDPLTSPERTYAYLKVKLGHVEHEVFGAIWLDNGNKVIHCGEIFRGTIDGASVYPREVVKEALKHNAASVIFYHNHPSGNPEPSQADKGITDRLKKALMLVDIEVLDHVIVGGAEHICFSERGLI